MNTISLLFLVAILGTLLSSCINDTSRAGKPSIEQFSRGGEEAGCGEDFFFDSLEEDCVTACREGTTPATEEELADLTQAEDVSEELIEIIENSKGLCLEEVIEVKRPDEEVFVKSDYCSCLNSKPDILNRCDQFCASRSDDTPTLYGSVTLGPNVSLNDQLGSLEKWCNQEIDDGFSAPSCLLEADDGLSLRRFEVEIPINSNSFSADITGLEFNKTYVMRLVEQTSGARSSPFQLIRKRPDTDSGPTGPLKIMPVSQYTCVQRSTTQIGQEIFFEQAVRQHFYFASNEEPPTLSQELTPQTTCHDPTTGLNDSPLKPRLELIPQAFALWDLSDRRFVDSEPQDTLADINTEIERRLAEEFDVESQIRLFSPLPWATTPDVQLGNRNLGIYMQAFVDRESGRAFCPGNDEYFSDDPLFQLLREYIGVPTEGIYFAEKEPEALLNEDGEVLSVPTDIIIIRENLLKKIWFYYENDRHRRPDERTAQTKTIRFYYPADPDDPYVRKSTQRVYTVRSVDYFTARDSLDLPTQVPFSDRRIGCVPALDEN